MGKIASFEIVRSWRMLFRYPTSSVMSIVVMTIVFVGLFETATGIVGGGLSVDIDVELTIQKFILWTTMIMGFASVSSSIRDETLSGMIETVWMGAIAPAVVLAIRGLSTAAITLIINIVLGIVISVIYNRLSIFNFNFIFSICLVSISSLGVGLMLGAAVVVFKEIGPTLNLLQFLMLPLFMNDARYVGGIVELVAPGLYSLRFLAGGEINQIGVLLSGLWLLFGFIVMSIAVRYSKRNALVYQY